MVAKKSVEQLEALHVKELGTATAKASTRLASANEVLTTRLMAKQDAAVEQKGQAEELVQAARTIVRAEEAHSLQGVEEINKKLVQGIGLRGLADANEECRRRGVRQGGPPQGHATLLRPRAAGGTRGLLAAP